METPEQPHPPVHAHEPARPKRAGSLAIRIVIALVVIGGVAYYLRARGSSKSDSGSASGSGAGSGSGDRVVPVQVATAEKKDVPIWIEGLGSVAAFQQVTVRTQVDGRLDKVAFVEGQAVKKGDLLAQIDPRPFQVALESAEGALLRDKAQLEVNKAQLVRYKDLQNQQLVAASSVEQFQGAVGQYEGLIKIDQAQIDQARLQLDYAAIKSPLDGVTGVRLVDAGNIVHASDAGGLVVITQVDPAALYFTIPEDKLAEVEAAQEHGPVEVQVFSRDGKKDLGKGTLAVLDNQVNQTTATLRLKATVPNDKRLLWPNAFVKARMLLENRQGAIVIPAVALQQGPNGGTFVYVVDGGVAKMTPVVVALTTGETAIIDKGLSGGEQVVTEGANQLRNGGKVDTGSGKKDGSGSGGKPDGATGASGKAGNGGSGKRGPKADK